MGTVVALPQRSKPDVVEVGKKTSDQVLAAAMAGHTLRLYPYDPRPAQEAIGKLSEAGLIHVRPVIVGKDLGYWDVTWTGRQPEQPPTISNNVTALTPPAPARRLSIVST